MGRSITVWRVTSLCDMEIKENLLIFFVVKLLNPT